MKRLLLILAIVLFSINGANAQIISLGGSETITKTYPIASGETINAGDAVSIIGGKLYKYNMVKIKNLNSDISSTYPLETYVSIIENKFILIAKKNGTSIYLYTYEIMDDDSLIIRDTDIINFTTVSIANMTIIANKNYGVISFKHKDSTNAICLTYYGFVLNTQTKQLTVVGTFVNYQCANYSSLNDSTSSIKGTFLQENTFIIITSIGNGSSGILYAMGSININTGALTSITANYHNFNAGINYIDFAVNGTTIYVWGKYYSGTPYPTGVRISTTPTGISEVNGLNYEPNCATNSRVINTINYGNLLISFNDGYKFIPYESFLTRTMSSQYEIPSKQIGKYNSNSSILNIKNDLFVKIDCTDSYYIKVSPFILNEVKEDKFYYNNYLYFTTYCNVSPHKEYFYRNGNTTYHNSSTVGDVYAQKIDSTSILYKTQNGSENKLALFKVYVDKLDGYALDSNGTVQIKGSKLTIPNVYAGATYYTNTDGSLSSQEVQFSKKIGVGISTTEILLN